MIQERNPELNETLFTSMAAMFGSIISAKRMQNGLSQQELADGIDVPFNMVAKMEGGNKVSIAEYEKAFKFLGLTSTEVAEQVIALQKKYDAYLKD